jgi:hypothetical protein|tara:strand:+ start:1779 stop:2000 length:222 start_codon:yes stop_codon:yes gene_type:complete
MRKTVDKFRKSKEISSWLNAFSNNILPPALFLFIATVALHYIPLVSNTLLRVNLSVISIVSAALSLYIITLML